MWNDAIILILLCGMGWFLYLIFLVPVSNRIAGVKWVVRQPLRKEYVLIVLFELALWSVLPLLTLVAGWSLNLYDPSILTDVLLNLFIACTGFSLMSIPLLLLGTSAKLGPFSYGGMDERIRTELISAAISGGLTKEKCLIETKSIWRRARLFGNPKSKAILDSLTGRNDELGRLALECVESIEQDMTSEKLFKMDVASWSIFAIQLLALLALIVGNWVVIST